jgi:hypothetical protein
MIINDIDKENAIKAFREMVGEIRSVVGFDRYDLLGHAMERSFHLTSITDEKCILESEKANDEGDIDGHILSMADLYRRKGLDILNRAMDACNFMDDQRKKILTAVFSFKKVIEETDLGLEAIVEISFNNRINGIPRR